MCRHLSLFYKKRHLCCKKKKTEESEFQYPLFVRNPFQEIQLFDLNNMIPVHYIELINVFGSIIYNPNITKEIKI